MSSWNAQNCVNHPGRIALEKCEVCGKPLCAYCLYYTEDGQRLCSEHGEQARQLGLQVEEPGAYAEHLVGAQAGAVGKAKRGVTFADDPSLYHGNSTDLMALVGMLFSVLSVTMCCGAFYCLPVIGFLVSLTALLTSRHAHDPGRTRKLGLVGLLASVGAVAVVVGCLAFSMSPRFLTFNLQNWGLNPGGTPIQIYPSPTPTEPTDITTTPAESDSAAVDPTATFGSASVPR